MALPPGALEWAGAAAVGAAEAETAEVLQVDRQLRLIREQFGVCARDLVSVRQEMLELRNHQEAATEAIVGQVEAMDAMHGRQQQEWISRLESRYEVLQDRVEYIEQLLEKRCQLAERIQAVEDALATIAGGQQADLGDRDAVPAAVDSSSGGVAWDQLADGLLRRVEALERALRDSMRDAAAKAERAGEQVSALERGLAKIAEEASAMAERLGEQITSATQRRLATQAEEATAKADQAGERIGALEREVATLAEERADFRREWRQEAGRLAQRVDDMTRRLGDVSESVNSLESAVGSLAERHTCSWRLLGEVQERASRDEECLERLEKTLTDSLEKRARECELVGELEVGMGEMSARHGQEMQALRSEQDRYVEESKSAHRNLANVILTLDAYHTSLREQVVRLQDSTTQRFAALPGTRAMELEEMKDGIACATEGRLEDVRKSQRQLAEELRAAICELRSTIGKRAKEMTAAHEASAASLRARAESLERSVRGSLAEKARSAEASAASLQARAEGLERSLAEQTRRVEALGTAAEGNAETVQSLQVGLARMDAAMEVRFGHLERASWEVGRRKLAEELESTAATEAHAASFALQERLDRVECLLGVAPRHKQCAPPLPFDFRASAPAAAAGAVQWVQGI